MCTGAAKTWGQMAISNNGNQFYVNSGNGLYFCYDGLGTLWSSANYNIDKAPGCGLGWSGPTRGGQNPVKMSRDGNILINYSGTPTLTISYDGGYTFNFMHNRGQLLNVTTTTLLNAQGFSIYTLSYTGQYMLLGENTIKNLFLSSNYGLTFISIGGPRSTAGGISIGLPSSAAAITWSDGTLSTNAEVSVVLTNTIAYLSTNSFASFSIISGPTSQFPSNGLPTVNTSWYKAVSSYDGSVLIIFVNFGILYLSTNTGTSWAAIAGTANSRGLLTSGSATYSLSMSGNGRYILIPVTNGGLYLSTNTGTSFTQIAGLANTRGLPTTASLSWGPTEINQDGSIMMAAISPGRLYYSTSYGASWITYNFGLHTATQNLPYSYLSMSADGRKTYVTCNLCDSFILSITNA
jgi:hypothetical protein